MRNVLMGLLECTVAASVVILAVAALRAAFARRLPPAVMLALWALALARLLLPVALPSPVHVDSLIPRPATQTVTTDTVSGGAEASSAAPQTANQALPSSEMGNPFLPQATPSAPYSPTAASQPRWFDRINLWTWGLVLWGLGAMLTLGLATVQGLRLCRMVRLCEPVNDATLLREVDALRRDLGIRSTVRALCCDWAATPMVYGMRRPALLLPPAYLSMHGDALRGVLLHELGHIRRHDILLGRLWLLARAAHWFNPLVHMAHRLCRDDVELARDAMATARLSESERLLYGETLLAAARARRRTGNPAPAAALLGLGGSSIGARVRSVLTPRRPSRHGPAVAAALAVVLVFGCFTTACQPTPEKPAVVSKNDGKLEEKLTQTATPIPTSSAAAQTLLRERMDMPETCQYEQTNDDDTVHLRIDATVEVPNVAAAAVYKAEVAPFTLEKMQKIHEVLLGGAQLYERGPKPREYWQEQIVVDQQMLAEAKENGDADLQESVENDLASVQEHYANTPENIERLPMELEYRKDTDDSGADVLRATTEVAGRPMAIFAANSANYSMVEMGLTGDDQQLPMVFQQDRDLTEPTGVQITREQALQQATQWMAQIDPNVQAVSVMPGSDTSAEGQSIWLVTFVRIIDGMPSNDSDHWISMENEDANMPGYEQILLGLNDDGFAYLNWRIPLNVTENVNNDAALLSFPKLQDIVAQAAYHDALGKFEAKKDAYAFYDLKVERMVLGLTRIAQKDKPGEFLLVPSWNVYGTPMPDEKNIPEKKRDGERRTQLLFTINALDGSIIDTQKGY